MLAHNMTHNDMQLSPLSRPTRSVAISGVDYVIGLAHLEPIQASDELLCVSCSNDTYMSTQGTAASGTRNWIEPLTDKRVHDCPPHTPERTHAGCSEMAGRAHKTHAQSTALALGRKDQDRRTMAPGDAVARNETTDPTCKHCRSSGVGHTGSKEQR